MRTVSVCNRLLCSVELFSKRFASSSQIARDFHLRVEILKKKSSRSNKITTIHSHKLNRIVLRGVIVVYSREFPLSMICRPFCLFFYHGLDCGRCRKVAVTDHSTNTIHAHRNSSIPSSSKKPTLDSNLNIVLLVSKGLVIIVSETQPRPET